MRSIGLALPKSRGALLMELAQEMKMLKEELDDCMLHYVHITYYRYSHKS